MSTLGSIAGTWELQIVWSKPMSLGTGVGEDTSLDFSALWHRRLGHPAPEVVKLILNKSVTVAASSEFQYAPLLTESSPVHVSSFPSAVPTSSAPVVRDSIHASDEIHVSSEPLTVSHASEPLPVVLDCSLVAE
ncbi:hypothetical protein V6N12_071010 [Hibiscus sabdariffa]|uniref:GAG-pre-integrase domain-containing protein n=1 Tax=Hibiscus sabdariffa TaxID=183260 RepID=A0ABR2FIJ6_9ROSI